jgi:glucose/arabinose dehydrogenase
MSVRDLAIGSLLVLSIAAPAKGAELRPGEEAALAAEIVLPEGWRFTVYAMGLDSPRLMQLTPGGGIIVSLPRSGTVARLASDQDGDGKADATTVLARGLRFPHGLLLENDKLYVAEEHRITLFDFDGAALSNPRRIAEGLPVGGDYTSRTLKRGPDGSLYLSVGASCNVCHEASELSATILRLGEDGQLGIFARGLRNTVGFDWQLATGMLYGLDNGRDGLGDVIPPDELNLILDGQHYGWPYRYGQNVKDPEAGDRIPDGLNPIQPVYEFDAHVAPLAMSFLESTADPQLKSAALVTKHGSWNRSERIGYEIVSLHWHDDGRIAEQPFMTGCLRNNQVLCRPVDVIEAPDGTLFVSDDYAGAIYRLSYEP